MQVGGIYGAFVIRMHRLSACAVDGAGGCADGVDYIAVAGRDGCLVKVDAEQLGFVAVLHLYIVEHGCIIGAGQGRAEDALCKCARAVGIFNADRGVFARPGKRTVQALFCHGELGKRLIQRQLAILCRIIVVEAAG